MKNNSNFKKSIRLLQLRYHLPLSVSLMNSNLKINKAYYIFLIGPYKAF